MNTESLRKFGSVNQTVSNYKESSKKEAITAPFHRARNCLFFTANFKDLFSFALRI